MRRSLSTIACMLSLVICLAALLLWIPSYRWGQSVSFSRKAAEGTVISYEIVAGAGCFGVEILRIKNTPWNVPRSWWEASLTDESAVVPRNIWERIGFVCYHTETPGLFGATASVGFIAVPHWLVAGVFAVLPVQRLRHRLKRRRARRRAAAGACPGCGYDLTGNTSGICPECGVKVDEKAGTSA